MSDFETRHIHRELQRGKQLELLPIPKFLRVAALKEKRRLNEQYGEFICNPGYDPRNHMGINA